MASSAVTACSGRSSPAAIPRVSSRKLTPPRLASLTSQFIAWLIQGATGRIQAFGTSAHAPSRAPRGRYEKPMVTAAMASQSSLADQADAEGGRVGGGQGHGRAPRSSRTAMTSGRPTTPTVRPFSITAKGMRGGLDLGGEVGDLAPGVDGAPQRSAVGGAHDRARAQDSRPRRVAGERSHVAVGGGDQQVLGGADLDDAPGAHDGDAVGQPDRLVEVVGDEDDGLLQDRLQPQELVLHLAADQRIERRERLVEEPELGADRQRAGDADALLLAAGELAREARLAAAEANELDHLARPRLARRPRRPLHLQREGDVPEHRQVRQQGEVLEHHAHAVAAQLDQLAAGDLSKVAPLEEHLPRRRLDQPRQAAHQRRLARAGKPHDDENLALADREIGVDHRRGQAGPRDRLGVGRRMRARRGSARPPRRTASRPRGRRAWPRRRPRARPARGHAVTCRSRPTSGPRSRPSTPQPRRLPWRRRDRPWRSSPRPRRWRR